MAERPVLDPAARVAAPAGGVPTLLRVFAVAQAAIALGALIDFAYTGFVDGTKLASGMGFALMAPWHWHAGRTPVPARPKLLKGASVVGIVLALAAMVARAF